jgi:hypothetical protein
LVDDAEKDSKKRGEKITQAEVHKSDASSASSGDDGSSSDSSEESKQSN